MRKTVKWNEGWLFQGRPVMLPHTWNAQDGQDGGNDYYRGECEYQKKFMPPELKDDGELWIEFRGAANRARIVLNGEEIGEHEGGYAAFRMNLTKALREGENLLAVKVDNSQNRTVYPQKADFTFYGGIYRDVYLITVPRQHFALDCNGASGFQITPALENGMARIQSELTLENWERSDMELQVSIYDAEGNCVSEKRVMVDSGTMTVCLELENPHLWDGLENPYLYTAKAYLYDRDRELDAVETAFGCRTFHVDSEKGFFLNGRSYPLCGVAKHQDWQGVGNAVSREMIEKDMELILEMGANTVRAAHYQHDQYFYDLADRYGLIIWAEIPYITEHMPEARENTVSQMTELVRQNYNHPSIICWALSNEISTTGGVNTDMVENHHILNNLCHQLDKTRLTAMANVFLLETDSEMIDIPDIRSYNLYYGWYLGELEDNDRWFDEFHKKYPDKVIGLSEYGADANPQYQAERPVKGDYTEGYQALYHEHMIKMWKNRPYIWAMHVWNMFDFGADGREEGGNPGRNQKGLVSFDRKIKKDAFYLYKAYLSREPFVHICGRRYQDRECDVTEVKVYSNQPEVELWVDGKKEAVQKGGPVFCFPLEIGNQKRFEENQWIELRVLAVDGKLEDSCRIRKVREKNPDYAAGGGIVTNWFDQEELAVREGFYSIQDSMGELRKSAEAMALIQPVLDKAQETYGDLARNVQIPKEMQEKMDAMPLKENLKMAGKAVTADMIKELNQRLGRVPKK